VLRGHGAECGYYDQETGDFLDDGTPLSEVRRRYPALTDGQIRSHLALFLFRGESETDKPVPALSGGERARLALALLVMEKPSWLAMDEPTNHLDLAGRTALEEMLAEFQGALVLISHDRQLLDDLCTKIIEVDAGGLREFVGNYTHWRAVKAAETAEAQTRANKKTADRKAEAKKKAGAAAAPKPQGQGQGQGKGQGSGQVRNPYKFKQLEERIMKLEERLERLNRDLTREEVYRDAAKAREVQFEIAEIEAELEDANETWSNWG
jgi:ATP-binding cassette subfamily F protein 3